MQITNAKPKVEQTTVGDLENGQVFRTTDQPNQRLLMILDFDPSADGSVAAADLSDGTVVFLDDSDPAYLCHAEVTVAFSYKASS